MEPFMIHCMLITISLPCVEAMSSKTYGGKIELFNKVSIYEPLENKHTGSLLRCSVLCGIGCNCFNFNLKTGTCLLYNSCNPLHLTVSEIGWRFFTDPSLDPIENKKLGFVVLFMGRTSNDTKNVYIASKKGASMNISTSQVLHNSLKRQIDGTVSIASSQHMIFPPQMELDKFKKELKSVFIETFGDSYVVSLDNMKWYAGSLGLIPIHKLSTYYVVISTEPSSSFSSQFALAAIKNNTSVSITLKMKQNIPLYINGNSFLNGDAYTLTLDRFETYQIAHGTDLTGTVVQSSKPIAVFSGNDCNWIENIGYCDPLIEQVIPTAKLDNTYIVPPNSNDRNTKVLITAVDQSNISYTVDQTTQTVTLNKLDSFDIILSSRQTCVIESNTTIIVTSFGLSSQISDMGDPSMTNVPGVHQYIGYYKTIVPYGFNYSYVTVIMKQSLKDSIRINNTAINRNNVVFEENVSAMKLSYNVRSIQVEAGEVTVSTVGGEKFGLMFSGVKAWAAYGFSAFNL